MYPRRAVRMFVCKLLAVLTSAASCSPRPPRTSHAGPAELHADQPCPKTNVWLAGHSQYREQFAPIVDAPVPDSGGPVWLAAPRVEYPWQAVAEQWEGRGRVIGIVDTVGRFVHADVCGIELHRSASEREPLRPSIPPLDLIQDVARATLAALPAARVTPVSVGGRPRNFVAVVPVYYSRR